MYGLPLRKGQRLLASVLGLAISAAATFAGVVLIYVLRNRIKTSCWPSPARALLHKSLAHLGTRETTRQGGASLMGNRALTAILQRAGDLYLATCPELGTASQGATEEEAVANLKEATELYLSAVPEEPVRPVVVSNFTLESVPTLNSGVNDPVSKRASRV
jgi:predicted RNase H-like HicB family nuclease